MVWIQLHAHKDRTIDWEDHALIIDLVARCDGICYTHWGFGDTLKRLLLFAITFYWWQKKKTYSKTKAYRSLRIPQKSPMSHTLVI